MTAELLGQLLINGALLGLLYALVAVGFSLIYGVCNIPFFTVGELYMLGAVLGFYFVYQLGIPYVLAVIIVMLVMGAIGIGAERFFRPLRGQLFAVVVVSLALAMAIANLALNIVGERPKVVPAVLHIPINLFGINLTVDRIVVVAACVAVVLALHFFNQRTKAGQGMRAIAQDPEVAALQGIDINRSQAITFSLGFAICGLAGILIAPIYYVDVFMGSPTLMKVIIVVVLGGLGSFPGAIAGGLLLGFIQSFGYAFIGGITHLISFAIVIVFLIFRPRGLLGRE